MKKLLYIFLIPILFAACGNDLADEQSGFVIKGKITNYPEKTIHLSELTTKGLRLIDSTTVNPDGTFTFTGKLPEKTFCTISIPNSATVLVVDSNSHINISVDANSPDQYGVNGSEDSELLRKMLGINNKYMAGMRLLEKKYEKFGQVYPSATEQEQMRFEYDSIMTLRTRDLQSFALSVDNSIIAYFATNFLLPESDFEFIDKIDAKNYPRLSASKYAQEHRKRVDELRKTAPGQVAPDIVLSDPFGKTVAMSSLRGKVVLVDFWASWCKPCRIESPNLVRIYNKYKTMGFEIFSVSLDDNAENWQKAINDDKLLWTHVSDLMKWNSQVVNVYKIDAIPYTVLLDRDGRVLAKNLKGESLDQKLAEIFK